MGTKIKRVKFYNEKGECEALLDAGNAFGTTDLDDILDLKNQVERYRSTDNNVDD